MDEEDLIDIKIPPPPDDGSGSEHDEDPKGSLLAGEQRRGSDPGIKPSPMPGVILLSRFVTFWYVSVGESYGGPQVQGNTKLTHDKTKSICGKTI